MPKKNPYHIDPKRAELSGIDKQKVAEEFADREYQVYDREERGNKYLKRAERKIYGRSDGKTDGIDEEERRIIAETGDINSAYLTGETEICTPYVSCKSIENYGEENFLPVKLEKDHFDFVLNMLKAVYDPSAHLVPHPKEKTTRLFALGREWTDEEIDGFLDSMTDAMTNYLKNMPEVKFKDPAVNVFVTFSDPETGKVYNAEGIVERIIPQ